MSARTQSFEARSKRTCRSKKSYANAVKARSAAEKFSSNHSKAFYVYQCSVCRDYHLSTRE